MLIKNMKNPNKGSSLVPILDQLEGSGSVKVKIHMFIFLLIIEQATKGPKTDKNMIKREYDTKL